MAQNDIRVAHKIFFHNNNNNNITRTSEGLFLARGEGLLYLRMHIYLLAAGWDRCT